MAIGILLRLLRKKLAVDTLLKRVLLQEKWETHCRKPLVEKVEQVLSLKPGSATDKTVSALWELCQNEAALLGTTDQFCSIFTDEVPSFD